MTNHSKSHFTPSFKVCLYLNRIYYFTFKQAVLFHLQSSHCMICNAVDSESLTVGGILLFYCFYIYLNDISIHTAVGVLTGYSKPVKTILKR